MIVVACITFGHEPTDIEECLAPALGLAKLDSNIRVIAIDDCSGVANQPAGIDYFVTPTRRGFPAVVQYIVEDLFPACTRLVLINPDALLDDGLRDLMQASETVAVPTIEEHGRLHNVRRTTTALREFRNLLLGEARSNWPVTPRDVDFVLQCPPFAPSGAVISIDAEALRRVPLDADLFWLEFSDWVLSRNARGQETTLRITPHISVHVGASTSVSYPLSVASSQARAKVIFVKRYGSILVRSALPLAVASKALRYGVKHRSVRDAYFVFQAAFDRVDWKVPS